MLGRRKPEPTTKIDPKEVHVPKASFEWLIAIVAHLDPDSYTDQRAAEAILLAKEIVAAGEVSLFVDGI